METGAPRRELVGHTGRCFDSSLRCREGAETLIATASEDGTARVWSGGTALGRKDAVLTIAHTVRRPPAARARGALAATHPARLRLVD